MDNKLSEEELERIKNELRKEVEAELKQKNKKSKTTKTGTVKKSGKTSSKVNNKVKKVEEKQFTPKINSTIQNEKVEFKIPDKKKTDYFNNNVTKKQEPKKVETEVEDLKSSPTLIIIIVILMGAGIIFLPKVYKLISSDVEQEKIEDKKEEVVVDEKIEYSFNDSAIKDLTYPIMRSNKYSLESLYQNDKVKVSDFSNNDILYNAFLDIYFGNISNYGEEEGDTYDQVACISEDKHKTFKANYLDARIKNLFTKSLEYNHTDFYVPSNVGSEYPGLWKYDALNYRYVYYGDCTPNPTSDTEYYDIKLEKDIKTSDDGTTVYLTYYVAFAKISNGTYTLYKDANYEQKLIEGTFENIDDLESKADIYKDNLNTYKYTFSNSDCSYKDFCYIESGYNK